MMDLITANIVPILIAVVIGLIVGWLVLRRTTMVRTPPAATAVPKPVEPLSPPIATEEPALVGTEPADLPVASGPPDTLQTLKGVGPKLAAKLNEMGITRFDQLAALSPSQADRLDAELGTFSGRLKRDRLVEQAGYLSRGDLDGFQKTFGNLGTG